MRFDAVCRSHWLYKCADCVQVQRWADKPCRSRQKKSFLLSLSLSLVWLGFIRSGCCFGWCRADANSQFCSYATITEHKPSHISLVGFCSSESDENQKQRHRPAVIYRAGKQQHPPLRVDKGRSALTGHSKLHWADKSSCTVTTNTCV